LCLRGAVDLSVGGGPRGHRWRGTVAARGGWWVPRWRLGRAGGVGRVGGRDGVHGGSARGCGTGGVRSVPRVLGAGGTARFPGPVRACGRQGVGGLLLRSGRLGRSGGGWPVTRVGSTPAGFVPTARVAVFFTQDLLRLSLYCSVGRRCPPTGSEEPPAGQPSLDTCPEAGGLGLRKSVHRRGCQFGRSIGQDGVDETVRLPHALVLARVATEDHVVLG